MLRVVLLFALMLYAVVPAVNAQESDDAVEHSGYVWSVSLRGEMDEPDSTYFIFCRQKVRYPSYEQCRVVWLSGGADVSAGEYARVKGVPASITQARVSELRDRFLNGERTDTELAELREAFDVLNCHQMLRSMGYGPVFNLIDSFDELHYIRAMSASRTERPPE